MYALVLKDYTTRLNFCKGEKYTSKKRLRTKSKFCLLYILLSTFIIRNVAQYYIYIRKNSNGYGKEIIQIGHRYRLYYS